MSCEFEITLTLTEDQEVPLSAHLHFSSPVSFLSWTGNHEDSFLKLSYRPSYWHSTISLSTVQSDAATVSRHGLSQTKTTEFPGLLRQILSLLYTATWSGVFWTAIHEIASRLSHYLSVSEGVFAKIAEPRDLDLINVRNVF